MTRSAIWRWVVAVVTPAAAVLLRTTLNPLFGQRFFYGFFYLVVTFVSWFGGLWPGLLSLALSSLAIFLFMLQPSVAETLRHPGDLISFSLFNAISILLILLAVSRRRALGLADRNAAEARSKEASRRESEERYRAFLSQSSEAIWRFELEEPCPVSLPEDEQIEHFYRHAFLAECNDIMARIYGYESCDRIAGARLGDMLVRDDPANIEYLRAFIRSDYRLTDAESREVDREGRAKVFLNNLIGIIEDGHVKRAWGTQRDITKRKQAEEAVRFQAHLLDTVEQAVIATDLQGNITFWNKFAEKLYGWTVEEALERNIVEITPAQTSQEQAAEIMSRLSAGESWSGEFLLRRRDGTTFPALVMDVPIHGDNSGELIGIVGVSVDVTERKRAEAALREADQRAIKEYERLLDRLTPLAQALGTARDLQTIFRALRDFFLASMPCIGVFVSLYDAERDVRIARYAWGEGMEIDVSTLPPMPITDGPNSRAVRTNQIIITDDYLKATQGHLGLKVGVDNGLMPQSSMAAPMSVMGRMVGTIEVQSYDLAAYRHEHATAMRVAANLAAVAIENARLFELETLARANAEAASRTKDEFLATLSHELRTPLTAMLGWTALLRGGNLDEQMKEQALEVIDRNAHTQGQLIEDILDVSRIITGKLNLSAQPVELTPIIESAVATVRHAIEAKGIDLRLSLNARAGVVSGDPTRLQQIVWNLLSNAVKFTPHGGRIEVNLDRADSCLQIKVSDTGVGISPEFLPYVFDRFRQADSTTTRAHSGLGLGLAIVRHLVELHGGTVRAESAGEGRGSTFTVRFPVMALRAQPSEVDLLWDEDTKSVLGQRPGSLEGVHVLVVDNEQDARALLRAGLEECGAQVSAASSVAEALKMLAQLPRPDVLVSDIGMPDRDGYDLIRGLRETEALDGAREFLPAVALTAYVSDEDVRRALAAGYQAHLAKPIELDKLAATVAQLAAGDEGKANQAAK